MAINPLQQYFRQPKLYVELPSKGVFSPPGTVTSAKITVMGMTGMDEILMKTPDALLSGDSIASVVKSCCLEVNDPYQLTNSDIDCLLIAIRIATYGNTLSTTHTCTACNAEHDYDIDLNTFMEHFKNTSYLTDIKFKDFTIKIKPLSFRQANTVGLDNFKIQRQLYQLEQITDAEKKLEFTKSLFDTLNQIQTTSVIDSAESIELKDQMVTDLELIAEFLKNCDRDVFDKVREKIIENNNNWRIPKTTVVCSACNESSEIVVELNQTNFFAVA
jgi:hypothetical protein